MSETRRNYLMNGARVPARPVGQIFSKTPAGGGDAPSGGAVGQGRYFSSKATKTVAIDLSVARSVAANTALVVPFRGSLIHCPYSTNSTDLAMVQLDNGGDPIPVSPHYSMSGNGYTQLTITNAATAGATMYLVLALETVEERLLVL